MQLLDGIEIKFTCTTIESVTMCVYEELTFMLSEMVPKYDLASPRWGRWMDKWGLSMNHVCGCWHMHFPYRFSCGVLHLIYFFITVSIT